MSERVTGRLIRHAWVYVNSDGTTGTYLYGDNEARHIGPSFPGRFTRVAIVEVDETPQAAGRAFDAAMAEGCDAFERFDRALHAQMAANEEAATMSASPPWPPKWGEGPTSGWCRRKADGHGPLRWTWIRPVELRVDGMTQAASDGRTEANVIFVYRDQFAAEFEPI